MDALKKVVQKFNMANYSLGNKVAICGTGKYATLLSMEYDTGVIDCYVDEQKAGEHFLNKPVICASNLPSRNVSAVIIAASVPNEIIIYDRIKQFCEENGIEIYSVHYGPLINKVGGDFSGCSNFAALTERKYQAVVVAWKELLYFRGLMGENDFFRLLESRVRTIKNFGLIRQEAGKKAKDKQGGLDYVYKEIAYTLGMTDKEAAAIKAEEEKLLFDILINNSALVELLRRICAKGTSLVICNESIYSHKLILQLVSRSSICDISNINVIARDELTKRYAVDVPEKKGANNLFIVNDCGMDSAMWRLQGNDVCIIKYGNDVLTSFVKKAYSLNTRCLLSLSFKKHVCDYSFKNETIIGNIYDLVYLCVAPLVTAYTIWLAKNVSRAEYGAVLFAARDGFIIKKLYDYLRDNGMKALPPSVYLYTSRLACMKAGVWDEDDLKVLQRFTGKSVQALLAALFDNRTGNGDNAAFLELSSVSRKNYYAYLDRIKIDCQHGKYAFMDLISKGTSQFFLQKLFANTLDGYYLSYQPSNLGVVQFESLFPSMKDEEVFSDDMRNFLETILTSTESSAIGFDSAGNAVFSEKLPTRDRLEYITAAQQAIYDYFRAYCNHYYCEVGGDIEYMMLIEWMEHIRENVVVAKDIFKDIDLFDDLWHESIRFAFSKG